MIFFPFPTQTAPLLRRRMLLGAWVLALALGVLGCNSSSDDDDDSGGGTLDGASRDQQTMLERRGAPDWLTIVFHHPELPGVDSRKRVESWVYLAGGTQLVWHNGFFVREETLALGSVRPDLPDVNPGDFTADLSESDAIARYGTPTWSENTQWLGRPARVVAWHGDNGARRPVMLAWIDNRLVGVVAGLLITFEQSWVEQNLLGGAPADDDDIVLDDDDIVLDDDDDIYTGDDPCCTPDDPCDYAGDGLCDCWAVFDWNVPDCSGGDICCAPDDPCNFANDGFCDCGRFQSWDARDCGLAREEVQR